MDHIYASTGSKQDDQLMTVTKNYTCIDMACATEYSVSALNCLQMDLHCTGVISVSFGETCTNT